MSDNSTGEVATTKSSSSHNEQKSRRLDFSLVEYYGQAASYCGYCKQGEQRTSTGRRTHDMNTYHLTASDYQDMLDRGWRRSGSFCYSPMNQSTCCPNYPIICKVSDFVLTRSLRKCIMTMNSFLLNGTSETNNSTKNIKYIVSDIQGESSSAKKVKHKSFDEIKSSSKAKDRRFVKICEKKMKLYGIDSDEATKIVRERWSKKIQPTLKLEDFLFPRLSDDEEQKVPRHRLRIDMNHTSSQASINMREAEHSIMIHYQQTVHKETDREWTMSRYCDFLVDTPIIDEPMKDLYHLKGSQEDSSQNIDPNHSTLDVCGGIQSETLLVKPPQLPVMYGTYHCSYHLDEELIAVGVLDVLPRCVTTVYFFYNPDYSFLNLGIYSALVEIALIRRLNSLSRDNANAKIIKDYNLGFLVPECKKMLYKTRFKPSYLLCFKTFKYVPTEICMEKLKKLKYVDFSDDSLDHSEKDKFKIVQLLVIPIHSPVDSKDLKLTSYLKWLEEHLGSEYANLFASGYLLCYAQLIGSQLLPKLHMKIDFVHRTLLERYKRLKSRGSALDCKSKG